MIKNIDIWLTNFLLSIGLWGYLLSCVLIIFESIIPILPLCVFITLLFYKFGIIIGFIISYICTIIGCIFSYKIFNGKLRLKFDRFLNKQNNDKLNKIKNSIEKIKFVNLCLIIALPFTPAFLVNIAAGLTNISKRKYILSLIVGKIFLIIFWGFVGTSVIGSFKEPSNLIFIGLLLVACFILSKLVSKKEGLE